MDTRLSYRAAALAVLAVLLVILPGLSTRAAGAPRQARPHAGVVDGLHWLLPAAFGQTGGMNLESPIDMVAFGMTSRADMPVVSETSRTPLNTNAYDGSVSYQFEVVASNNTGVPQPIQFLNHAGSVVATIPLPYMPYLGDYVLGRFTTGFIPTPGSDDYRIRFPQAPGDSVNVFAARLLVRQVGATRTRLRIPLSDGPNGTGYAVDSEGGIVKNTSYPASPQNGLRVMKDETAYRELAGATPWALEVMASSAQKAITLNAALFNRRTNAMVTGSQIAVTGGGIQTVTASFSNSATNFTNGDEFEVRAKISRNPGTWNPAVYKAALRIDLTNLSQAQVYSRCGQGSGGAANRILLDAAAYSNPTFYFEATGASTSASATATLYDAGTTDASTFIPADPAVPGSQLTFPAVTERLRTDPLGINSGDRYWSDGNSFVIIDTHL